MADYFTENSATIAANVYDAAEDDIETLVGNYVSSVLSGTKTISYNNQDVTLVSFVKDVVLGYVEWGIYGTTATSSSLSGSASGGYDMELGAYDYYVVRIVSPSSGGYGNILDSSGNSADSSESEYAQTVVIPYNDICAAFAVAGCYIRVTCNQGHSSGDRSSQFGVSAYKSNGKMFISCSKCSCEGVSGVSVSY